MFGSNPLPEEIEGQGQVCCLSRTAGLPEGRVLTSRMSETGHLATHSAEFTLETVGAVQSQGGLSPYVPLRKPELPHRDPGAESFQSLSLNDRSPGAGVHGAGESTGTAARLPAEPGCPGPSEEREPHRGQAGALGEVPTEPGAVQIWGLREHVSLRSGSK